MRYSNTQVDLRTIRKFCRMIQPEHLPALSEVEKQVWRSDAADNIEDDKIFCSFLCYCCSL